MSHKTYNDKWRHAVEDLKELLQLEQDCAVPAPTTRAEAAAIYPKLARLYVRYIVVINAIEDCEHYLTHPQKRMHVRRVLETLLVRLLKLKQAVIASSPREGSPHLFVADVLSYLDLCPEEALLRLPRYLKEDTATADEWSVKMQKLAYWASTLRADALRASKAATRIQAAWRGWSCRCRVKKMRAKTLVSWGLDFLDSGESSSEEGEKRLLTQVLASRKLFQVQAEKAHNAALESQRAWLRQNLGSELKRERFNEGREWMLEFRRQVGSFPVSLSDRTRDFSGVPPPPPDFRAYKVGMPGAKKKAQAKPKAKPEAAKKAGAGQNKAPKDVQTQEEAPEKSTLEDLQDLLTEFEKTWARYSCSLEQEQTPDRALTHAALLPQIESEVSTEVDDLLRQELSRLRLHFDLVKEKPAKKGGKKGSRQKGRTKQKKAKCCNAMKIVGPPEDIFPDLVKDGILKAIQPANLKDFIGSFPAMPVPTGEFLPAPNAWQIKQFLTEQIILPLASTRIREKTPFPARSLLLYGPPGAGKSLLARIIATEAGALFFDLSPKTIENLYVHPKTGASLMVHKTFLCAQHHAPAVIYIDEVDEVFMAKKGAAGKKKGKPGADAPQQSTAWRIREQLKVHLSLVKKAGEPLSACDRLLVIGCTSRPFAERVDQKGMAAFFDHKLWVDFPNYETRRMIWEALLKKKHAKTSVVDAARLATLAEMTEGYSAGVLEAAAEHVLVEPRVSRLAEEPVQPEEMVSALSRLPYCWPEDWLQFREFDFVATGEKARVATRKAQADAEKASAEKAKRAKN
ncbi:ATPase, AAA family protein [Besnoitia besnoiti]|uniref:ATPase, AAA family protein n=1 Tax=Besnoitia besnoiti TaxID=94643 RepID=A0A2A9M528_BESBE|nr:ATPase, AAA family protein [Besnoitia besnoiti]PFH32314.1 ATPase, AAA family protein [Besnoitia besnoiti]